MYNVFSNVLETIGRFYWAYYFGEALKVNIYYINNSCYELIKLLAGIVLKILNGRWLFRQKPANNLRQNTSSNFGPLVAECGFEAHNRRLNQGGGIL